MVQLRIVDYQDSINEWVSLQSKNSEKEKKDALSLACLLGEMTNVLSVASPSCSKSSCIRMSSDDQSNFVAPTTQAIADTLSQLAVILSSLKEQLTSSSDEQEKDLLNIEITQVEQAIKTFEKALQLCVNIQVFEQDASDYMSAIWWTWQHEVYDQSNHQSTAQDKAYLNLYMQTFEQKFGAAPPNPSQFSSLSDFEAAILSDVFDTGMQAISGSASLNTPSSMVGFVVKLLKSGFLSAEQAALLLQALLLQMSQMLLLMTKAQNDNEKEGPSSSLVSMMMSRMTSLVSSLQSQLAESSQQKSQNDSKIDQTYIALTQTCLQAAADQYAQMKWQETWGAVIQIISVTASLIIIAASCATGQYEIAAMTAFFLILQESGAITKATTFISDALVKLGIPPEEAKIVADLIVIAAFVVLSLGISAGASLISSASTIARAAAETATSLLSRMINMCTEAAVEDGSEATEEAMIETSTETSAPSVQSDSTSVAKSMAGKLGQQAMKGLNVSVLMGVQTAASSSVFQDIADAIAAAAHLNAKEKEILEITLEIVGSLICLTLGGISGSMLASQSQRIPALATALGPALLKTLAMTGETVGGILDAGAKTGAGIIGLTMANAEEEAGKAEAEANLFQNFEKQMNQNRKETIQFYHDFLKNQGQQQQAALSEMFAGQAAFARLLSQSV
jgi:hypothetical protein